MSKMTTFALTVALAAGLGIATGAPAHATTLMQTITDKAGDARPSIDITKITVINQTDHEPASVLIETAAPFENAYDGAIFWLNLDHDPKPNMVITAFTGSSVDWTKSNGWKGDRNITKNCGLVTIAANKASLIFDPHCLGKSKKMQVSVATFRYDAADGGLSYDYAPGKKMWTTRMKSQTRWNPTR